MKNVYDLIVARRTVRQFKPEPVPRALIRHVVDAGRLAPSAANLQPLEFIIVDEAAVRAEVFPCLKWAAYIAPAGNPALGREPAAYVVVLVNTEVREKMFEYDVGAANENMILAALAEGVASCWLLSIDRDKLRGILKVPERYRIDSVLAMGYPAEAPVAEEFKDSCRYWKDGDGTLYVPKRKRTDVLHINGFQR
jgi:nitroreductase